MQKAPDGKSVGSSSARSQGPFRGRSYKFARADINVRRGSRCQPRGSRRSAATPWQHAESRPSGDGPEVSVYCGQRKAFAKNTLPKLGRVFGEADRVRGCRLKHGERAGGSRELHRGRRMRRFPACPAPFNNKHRAALVFLSPVIISSDLG